MKTLNHLFSDELADRYDGEKQMQIAMPKLIEAATSTHLQKLLRSHLKETSNHARMLEKVFQTAGETPRTKKCEATAGLIREGEQAVSEYTGWPVVNAALIAVAQKMEHYEIATYGCLRTWAVSLANKEGADLLQQILVEEKAMNHALSELARSNSNEEAHGEVSTTIPLGDGGGVNSSTESPSAPLMESNLKSINN